MIRGQDVPLSVEAYAKTLKPIVDFTVLKEGQKMFNRTNLDVLYVDTFVTYMPDRDVVEYENHKGEIWCGEGKDYWFFID